MPEPVRPPAFITAPPRRVVFLCNHNSARSQMAEGLARVMAPPDALVWSAGTEPLTLHPLAVQVMAEIGADIREQRSKHLRDVPWQEADTIVTLCDEVVDLCPTVGPHVRRVYWLLPNPASAPEAERERAFREARDEIRWRVSSLWPRGDL